MDRPGARPLFASPTAFLMAVAFINYLGFASWQALFNNFAKDPPSSRAGKWACCNPFAKFRASRLHGRVWFMIMREQSLPM